VSKPSYKRNGRTILVWVVGNWQILKEWASEEKAITHLQMLERQNR